MGNEHSSISHPHASRSRSSSSTSTASFSSTISSTQRQAITSTTAPSSKPVNSAFLNPESHLTSESTNSSSTPTAHPHRQTPTPRPSPVKLGADLDASFLRTMDPRSPRPTGGCEWMFGDSEVGMVDEKGRRERFGFGSARGFGKWT